jgi:beta-N-acetylhexosaminidase
MRRLALLFAILAPLVMPSVVASGAPLEPAQRWAEQVLAEMTLEQKVGQIVFVDITAGYIPEDDPRLHRWINLVRDHGVGGVVFYGGTPRDVAALLNRLQRQAKVPVLMAADFEGGPGQQVSGATEFPANMAFAAINSVDLMYEAAKIGAIEGRAMGIGLTYSPAVDFTTRPQGPAESVRSFGSDLDRLGRLAKAYISGYMENGMLTAAKHFPGRGNVQAWPPNPLFTMIDKPAEAIESEDFAAFKKAIDAGVPFVMSEHIAVPSVTGGSDLTASVEKKLATGWLRGKLGFRGLLTTDDLWYDQVVERYGAAEVGVRALQAGHDLLLKPKDPAAMIQGVIEAVRKGDVAEAHIDQAVRKLLTWKARLGLHDNRYVDETKVNAAVGTQQHWKLAQQVADRSLTVLKNDAVLPLKAVPEKLVNITIQKLETDPSPEALAAQLSAAFPGVRSFTLRPGMDSAAYQEALQAARSAELVTISLFVQRDRLGDATPLRPADLQLIEQVTAARPGKVIAMSYGNPHLIRKIGDVPVFVVGYGERGWFGNQAIYFDSFIRLLKGEIRPEATLPVRVSEKYPVGSGVQW